MCLTAPARHPRPPPHPRAGAARRNGAWVACQRRQAVVGEQPPTKTTDAHLLAESHPLNKPPTFARGSPAHRRGRIHAPFGRADGAPPGLAGATRQPRCSSMEAGAWAAQCRGTSSMDANERPARGSVTRRREAPVACPVENTLGQVRGTPCLRHARWAAHTAGSVGSRAPRQTLHTCGRRGRVPWTRALTRTLLMVSAISSSK